MAKRKTTLATFWLDKHRKLEVSRLQVKKEAPEIYWIVIKNQLTGVENKLPLLTKKDLKIINEVIGAIDEVDNW
ncbi:hypothetical protein J2X97_000320 [Epilithonimonas hungarica]|uniref:hypothetical protein n=1 Tax=Epilithonimonas hungarica TaxID=454006 RepID=UPI0027812721|nr:hypothetical protein [Epilithonimonas hungarica]MDP9954683.1 hypothetical protein [Epilithonimonas hungarica]